MFRVYRIVNGSIRYWRRWSRAGKPVYTLRSIDAMYFTSKPPAVLVASRLHKATNKPHEVENA